MYVNTEVSFKYLSVYMYIHMVKPKKDRIKVTWSIDRDLVKKVKIEAIEKETDASSIVEMAIKKFLNKR